jgi:hypothetical protein
MQQDNGGGYVDGANLYLARLGAPINHVDPSGRDGYMPDMQSQIPAKAEWNTWSQTDRTTGETSTYFYAKYGEQYWSFSPEGIWIGYLSTDLNWSLQVHDDGSLWREGWYKDGRKYEKYQDESEIPNDGANRYRKRRGVLGKDKSADNYAASNLAASTNIGLKRETLPDIMDKYKGFTARCFLEADGFAMGGGIWNLRRNWGNLKTQLNGPVNRTWTSPSGGPVSKPLETYFLAYRYPGARFLRSLKKTIETRPGVYVYVQDASGAVHVLPDGPHLHPQVLGYGQPVAAAGTLTIDGRGVVVLIDNCSGTFRCPASTLPGVRTAIQRQGLTVAPDALSPH